MDFLKMTPRWMAVLATPWNECSGGMFCGTERTSRRSQPNSPPVWTEWALS